MPGQVYVEPGEDGQPVASAIDRDVAALSAVPPAVAGPVVTYRSPYYAYPYAPWPSYGPVWPSTSLYFSWSNARPWYPYRSWSGPPPVYHPPLPGRPHRYAAPPASHPPAPRVVAPPGVGRPPPAGGYRGFFGNRIGGPR